MYPSVSIARLQSSVSILALLVTILLVGCSTTSGVKSIQINAAQALAAGTHLQAQAIRISDDGAQEDVSHQVTWSSSDPEIAAVDANGLVTAKTLGQASIVARLGGLSNTLPLLVTAPTITSIIVTPPASALPAGENQQTSAIATYTDGSTADVSATAGWSILPANVAAISAGGVLTGVSSGTFSVTATLGQLSASATGAVSGAVPLTLDVQPSALSLGAHTSCALHLSALFSDGTRHDVTAAAAWQSSNPAVTGFSGVGIVDATAPGTATVTASLPSGALMAQASVRVREAGIASLALTPNSNRLAVATALPIHAIAIFSDGAMQDVTGDVDFVSSNPAVVSLGAGGLAQAVAPGQTQITANFNGQQATTRLEVTNATLSSIAVDARAALLPPGSTMQVRALGAFSDGSTQDVTSSVAWSSSNTQVLEVSGPGTVTGIAGGQAQIQASLLGQQAFAMVGVTDAALVGLEIDPGSFHLAPELRESVVARAVLMNGASLDVSGLVSWSSDNGDVVTVGDDQQGRMSARGAGSATLTASLSQLSPTGSPGPPAVRILHAAAAVVVDPVSLKNIVINPGSSVSAVNMLLQAKALGNYSDGSQRDITDSVVWTSLSAPLLGVYANGSIMALGAGAAQLSATIAGVSSASASVRVTPATFEHLTLSSSQSTVPVATSTTLTATGSFSDGTTQDLSRSVAWSASNPAIAFIKSGGLAQGASAGTSQVYASFAGLTANTPLSVTNTQPVSLAITAAPLSLPSNATSTIAASAIFADGTTRDVSTSAIWTASNASITITGAGAMLTTYTPGQAQVSASFAGQNAISTIEVQTTSLESLSISAPASSIAAGDTQIYSAIGTYSDGTTRDETANVSWLSSNPAVAIVDLHAVATGYAAGEAQISASLANRTGVSALAVTAASTNAKGEPVGTERSLVQLAVAPTNARIALGTGIGLHAVGIYSDGTREDLTGSVLWATNNTTIALEGGFALGKAAGQALVTAQLGSFSAQTTLTVASLSLVSLTTNTLSTTLAAGTNQQMQAIGIFSDGSKQDLATQVHWQSSKATVATIDNSGILSALAAGETAITMTFGSLTVSAEIVQVTSASLTGISIQSVPQQLALGTSQQLHVLASFSDGTTQDVTKDALWSSLTPAAAVSGGGLVTTADTGVAQVAANYQGQGSVSASFQVTSAALVGLTIAPASAVIGVHTTQQFAATGTFSDGTTQDLSSNLAIWQSNAVSLATVDEDGAATGQQPGTLQIEADFGGQTATAALTISSDPLATNTLTGNTHPVLDPSIMREGSTYYLFTTDVTPRLGSGYLPIRCSEDETNWRLCGQVFSSMPSWITSKIPGILGLWAPDISYFNGLYHLYYAGSTLGSQRSVIGLATNTTLDESDPAYSWVDQGEVIESSPGDDFNAIDPNVFLDTDDSAWLSYGSYWSGIKQSQLDPGTGRPIVGSTRYNLATRPAVPNNPIEGASIVHHGSYYYLFVSIDYCCYMNAAMDNYKEAVGRSTSVHGPFVDQNGVPMLLGGGTILLQGDTRWHAPGGATAYIDSASGESLLVFHALDMTDYAVPVGWLQHIDWQTDWPVLQP